MKEEKRKIRGLIYVHDSQPGLSRKKHGRGFIYFDEEKGKISNKKLLQRLKDLKIPPAWEKVWICKNPSGYIQATGYDNRRRKQYLYHPDWTELSRLEKFRKLHDFGKALPHIRQEIEKKLEPEGWPREKVLALVLKFMDEKRLRVGNKLYEEENQTYGLTTLRRKHLTEKAGKILIEYRGKSGKYRKIKVEDPELVRLIKESSELPGYEIFRYIDDADKSQRIDSADVNEFLQEITGKDFTSKTFRTWGGTVLAVEEWESAKEESAGDKRKSLKSVIVKRVAEKLGNTTSIAEQHYIHPYILQKISSEDYFYDPPDKQAFSTVEKKYLDDYELLVLSMLEHENG